MDKSIANYTKFIVDLDFATEKNQHIYREANSIADGIANLAF